MFNPEAIIKENLSTYNKTVPKKYRSSIQFDYINSYFQEATTPSDLVSSEESKDKSALWLTSYLAHWGMFRGSSNIKDTNIDFFKDLLFFLLNSENGVLKPIFDVHFERLHLLEQGVLDSIIKKFEHFLDKNGVAPTGTLISKIVLALLGNIPAYDRIFNVGLKKLKEQGEFNGVVGFGENSLRDLSTWYSNYSWPTIKTAVGKQNNLPTGRLVDLAIFQYGLS